MDERIRVYDDKMKKTYEYLETDWSASYTPSMDFANRITSASTSTARSTTPVSVEK